MSPEQLLLRRARHPRASCRPGRDGRTRPGRRHRVGEDGRQQPDRLLPAAATGRPRTRNEGFRRVLSNAIAWVGSGRARLGGRARDRARGMSDRLDALIHHARLLVGGLVIGTAGNRQPSRRRRDRRHPDEHPLRPDPARGPVRARSRRPPDRRPAARVVRSADPCPDLLRDRWRRPSSTPIRRSPRRSRASATRCRRSTTASIASAATAVPVVDYERFGSDALADRVGLMAKGRRGLLLRNHGAVTWGSSWRRLTTWR